jgi:hypothetical protein
MGDKKETGKRRKERTDNEGGIQDLDIIRKKRN